MKFQQLLVLAIGLTLFTSCQNNSTSNQKAPPNIILILTDDQGWGDLSFHGNDTVQTPHLDKLASESVVLDRFYVSPVCAPTRASLLTGRFHLRTGVTWVTHRKEVMNEEEVTLAEALKTKGYQTGIFGKWHNGEQYPHHPNGQGFDEFYGFCAGHWNNYFDTKLQHNGKEVQSKGYIIDDLTDKAIDFIQGNKDKPFFCYIPYNTPHSPMQVADGYYDKYKAMGITDFNAACYGMVENIDDNVKRILETLESENLVENTIFIFTTDNGPNGKRFNGGMKGRKGWVDEGGIRVPFFLKYPNGNFEHGIKIPEITSHIDLMPTLLELCGVEAPENVALDGKSLIPLLQKKSWEKRLIYTFPIGQKLTPNPGSVRSDTFRMVLERDSSVSLFNMLEDPGQQNNIADLLPEKTKELLSAYHQKFEEVTLNGSTPQPIQIGHQIHPTVHLPAPEAKLKGGVEFKEFWGWANDWTTNWDKESSMTWATKVVAAGDYEVVLEYACTEAMVGSTLSFSAGNQQVEVEIKEAHFPDHLPSPDRVERWEVYEKEWKKLKVGTFNLEKGETEFKLSAKNLVANKALEIKALWISPGSQGL